MLLLSSRCRRFLIAVVLVVLLFPQVASAATTFYPTTDASDVSGWKRLNLATKGSGMTTSVTKCIDGPVSDTQIQITETSNGTALKWLSDPLSAVTLAGTETLQLTDVRESTTGANSKVVCWVYRYDESTDAIESSTGAKFTPGATSEITTSQTDYTLQVNPFWDPALVNGDRIALICYIDDAGDSCSAGDSNCMKDVSSSTVTIEYAQASGDTEWMSLQIPETATYAVTGGLKVIDVIDE